MPDNDYLEGLIDDLTYRIEELERKIDTSNKQINESRGFDDSLEEKVEKLTKKTKELRSDLDDVEIRVDDLE